MAKREEITAAEALKAFGGKGITVQVATPAKTKGEDGGERDGFKTERAALTAKHVTSAARYDDGRVVIATIDGQKHETRA